MKYCFEYQNFVRGIVKIKLDHFQLVFVNLSLKSYKLAEYRSKGQIKTEKESLCREYIASVPRHYSHFSVSSSNEYVDCASSALNWWRGPLESNADGTSSPCFLEWLDERNTTRHLQLCKDTGWFPGVDKGEMPPALRDAEAYDVYPI